MKKIIIIIFPALFLYGCGVWANFTTYFNLYYNASDLFSQIEQDIKTQNKDLFETVDKPLPSSSASNIDKVIEKCSQILQFHANSSYVDDALLMIGKCFYYQANYQKAIRKFNELLATQPKSDLLIEANLWIGKSQMKLRDFDNGLKTLKDVIDKAQKSGDRKYIEDAYIEEVKYRIIQKDYSGAITLIEDFLKVSKDGEKNAQAAFELGTLYEQVDELPNAIKALQSVNDYSPTYDILLNSQIELGKALRDNNEDEKSLDLFESMSSQAKYSDAFDRIGVQRGITLAKMGRTEEAMQQLVKVDTTYGKTPSTGLAEYELGKILETKYQNFDSAKVYYEKAAGNSLTEDLTKEVRNKIDLLSKYNGIYKKLVSTERQILYIEKPEVFEKDSVDYYARMKELQKIEEEKKTERDVSRFFARNNSRDDLANRNKPGVANQPANNTTSNNQFGQNDSTKNKFGLSDSTNNKSGLSDSTKAPLDSAAIQQAKADSVLEAHRKQLDADIEAAKTLMKEPPPQRPTLSLDSLNSILVSSKFELGSLLFTEFNMVDSAYKYFYEITTNNPGSPYEAKSLYSLGSYYLIKDDTLKADSLFNIVYDKYKKDPIVNAAAFKLNKPYIDLNYDPVESLYQAAEKQLENKNYDSSYVNFYGLYKDHPKSEYAPKALYASGWLLENKLNLSDSAAAIYDTLASQYPNTIYAAAVTSKLSYYRSEKMKLQKASDTSNVAMRSDSSTAIASDSLKTQVAQKEPGVVPPNGKPGESLADRRKEIEAREKGLGNKNAANPDTLIRVLRRFMKK